MWTCIQGFVLGDPPTTCVACVVPAGGYSTGTGTCDFECRFGFEKVGSACVACPVPAGGFLTGGAECGFECTGHLVRNGTACDAAAAVVVSECGFGTELVSGECVACMVPTGGFLTGGAGCVFECTGDLVKNGLRVMMLL